MIRLISSALPDAQLLPQLAKAELLCEMGADVDTFAAAAVQLTVRRGQTLFVPGDPPALYVVLSGRVRVGMRRGSTEIPLCSRTVGEVFGESSLLYGRQVNEACAAEPCSLARIDAAHIRRALQRSPAASLALARLLAKRLALLEVQLTQGSGSSVLQRVEFLLERLAAHSQNADRRGVLLPYRTTQAEIAQLVGASRVAVSRALRTLRGSGRITVEGRRIFVRGGPK